MENPKERLIKKALDDKALDKVTGGGTANNPDEDRCPLCRSIKENGICGNLQCRNYGSYC